MELFQVSQVVWWEAKVDSAGSHLGEFPLELRERSFVTQVQAVSQDVCSGVAVRILPCPILV